MLFPSSPSYQYVKGEDVSFILLHLLFNPAGCTPKSSSASPYPPAWVKPFPQKAGVLLMDRSVPRQPASETNLL